MKALTKMLLVALLVVGPTNVVMAAQDTGDAELGIVMEEIAQIAITGAVGTLTLANSETAAGDEPTVQSTSTNLAWTSNVAVDNTRLITASLDAAYDMAVTVKLTLGSPGTGSTNGSTGGIQTLTTDEATLWTGITNENCSNAQLTYDVSLSSGMFLPTSVESQTVTITLAAGSA